MEKHGNNDVKHELYTDMAPKMIGGVNNVNMMYCLNIDFHQDSVLSQRVSCV